MGYTTSFSGHFDVSPARTAAQVAYLQRFAEIRHVRRDINITFELPDPIREAVGLPITQEGQYFVGHHDVTSLSDGVLDCYKPPVGQPGLFCQWVPSTDGTKIIWDNGESFYDYVEWIKYIMVHFLTPWGRFLSGTVEWAGDDRKDLGKIVVYGNHVRIFVGETQVTYKEVQGPGLTDKRRKETNFEYRIQHHTGARVSHRS